ncbi:MAG: hypothetical protein V1771_05090 [Chloroflexota bacterium]
MVRTRRWSLEDKETVRAGYDRTAAGVAALAGQLGRTVPSINGMAKKLHLKHEHPRWTREDIDYLKEHIGLTPDDEICAHLHRTRAALHIACVRKLRRGKLSNIFTARNVASIVGVGDAKTVVYWQKRGFLKGRRLFRQGPNLVWHFDPDDIEKCLRKRPWLVDLTRAENHSYFRSVILEEYERDSWYTSGEASILLGFKDPECVKRWARRGLLKSDRKPMGGAGGEWIIRGSAIEIFKANILPGLLIEHRLKAMRTRRQIKLDKGMPIQLKMIWNLACPHCGEMVTIEAHPRLHGDQVSQLYKVRVNGTCVHQMVLDKDQADVARALRQKKEGLCDSKQ